VRKPKITTPKIENPNARTGAPMGFKVNDAERAVIEEKARKLAGGNVSAYLRHAALYYRTDGK
jgi:hypothetical protein